MNSESGRRSTLPLPVAFSTVTGVLVVSLWASGAPSMVYPLFADQWDVGEIVTTSLFAAYPVALVLALLACGSLSDALGRRRVLLVGVAIIAAGAALFGLADGVLAVFAGRALQGIGVGVAMSAASAALIEFVPQGETDRATFVNTAATASGTAIAVVLGGALVEYSPLPTRLPFVILLVATIGLLPLLWFLPEPIVPSRSRWRPSPVRLPATGRLPFSVGALSFTVAFMTGAVFIALGAHIVKDLVGSNNAFAAALTLASWAIAIVPASAIARRGSPRSAVVIGSALAVLGSIVLIAAAEADSLAAFLVAAVLSGAGYGWMFYGGLGIVIDNAESTTRAATLSLMYLVSYLAQGLTAVGIGWLATVWGLDRAMAITMPTIAVLSITSAVAALVFKGRHV